MLDRYEGVRSGKAGRTGLLGVDSEVAGLVKFHHSESNLVISAVRIIDPMAITIFNSRSFRASLSLLFTRYFRGKHKSLSLNIPFRQQCPPSNIQKPLYTLEIYLSIHQEQ